MNLLLEQVALKPVDKSLRIGTGESFVLIISTFLGDGPGPLVSLDEFPNRELTSVPCLEFSNRVWRGFVSFRNASDF